HGRGGGRLLRVEVHGRDGMADLEHAAAFGRLSLDGTQVEGTGGGGRRAELEQVTTAESHGDFLPRGILSNSVGTHSIALTFGGTATFISVSAITSFGVNPGATASRTK